MECSKSWTSNSVVLFLIYCQVRILKYVVLLSLKVFLFFRINYHRLTVLLTKLSLVVIYKESAHNATNYAYNSVHNYAQTELTLALCAYLCADFCNELCTFYAKWQPDFKDNSQLIQYEILEKLVT